LILTEILFSFDTEDFTCDESNDAILEQARILHDAGIRANFNLVGYEAKALVAHRRTDVLEELKNHTVSFHTLAHSIHPDVNEYTDIESYEQAINLLQLQECRGIGMVEAATGKTPLAVCPPGNCLSYASMYFYAEQGMRLYVGSLFDTPNGDGVYYCNGFHTNYDMGLETLFFDTPDYDVHRLLDSIAGRKRVVLYNHPNMVEHSDFWDMVNYYRGNLRPFGDWLCAPRRSAEQISLYYFRLRELIDALQSDSRFVITDADTLIKSAMDKASFRRVSKTQLPAIQNALSAHFSWVNEPVSLSVCDCFYAAKHFMDRDTDYIPGDVHGFLQQPEGIRQPVTLTADEIHALAGTTDPASFLPPYFISSAGKIGPADLLFAMLEVAQGAKTVTLQPREQQCDYSHYPYLGKIDMSGSWVHTPDFKDRYLSDRLRLQAWTIRPEE